MRYAAVALCCLTLAGCAGGGAPESACELFAPPPADTPTAQNAQRVEMQATGDPTAMSPDEQDCD
ncbi:hypothetical protein DN824_02455 [Stutzerimonas nosocomialis]|uniref:Lipoprotein n=1 Tax=Stutzerimonas nosocomialis TaxID=1056496 RepID=A0A5R9QGU2_9GAMM|nr:hypothetical protein [Stutzerimonas nosocomialis]TLX53885.1 hypothetical protein DN826_16505 [Stutzerimonas nosocomialis]TLX60808.1 hypothetical protein DN824_02455 [Stutzerimonas nosocomialis]TLX64436.1 hypothetical protein DN820_05175 [Stutzerimonas nosocomialis]